MNKKKMLATAAGLAVLIAGSTVLYNTLAKDYEDPSNLSVYESSEEIADNEILPLDSANDLAEDNIQPEDENVEDTADNAAVEQEAVVESPDTLVSSDSSNTSSNEGNQASGNVSDKEQPSVNGSTNSTVGNAVSGSSDQNNSAVVPTAAPTAAPEVTKAPSNTLVPTVTKVPTQAPTMAPTATPVPTKAPVVSGTAASFTVQDYNGNSYSLSSFFGKPIVINFWASWCGPCKSEMADFNSVYAEMKNDVVFLMVDMVDGSRETKESGHSYVTSQGYSFPVYYDVNRDAAYKYSVTSYPTTVFIDANGNVVKTQKGAMSGSTLRSQINSLLR